jgi:hypothetical protein
MYKKLKCPKENIDRKTALYRKNKCRPGVKKREENIGSGTDSR